MLKAVLIALAVLIAFDAAVWGGEVRGAAVQAAKRAYSEVAGLDWDWDG